MTTRWRKAEGTGLRRTRLFAYLAAAALFWLAGGPASGQTGLGGADRYTASIEEICRRYATAITGMPTGAMLDQCMSERHCYISRGTAGYRCEMPGPLQWHGGGY
jgi:hypothetical protein